METIIKLIFGFLCGVLYIIGLIFNLTYQEISVYVCIYLWPIICIFSTFVIIYYLIKWILLNNKHRIYNIIGLILATFYSYTYILIFDKILTHYNVKHHSINKIFNLCYMDLIEISHKLNISYEDLNLYIYCYLFILIMIFNFSLTFMINRFNKN